MVKPDELKGINIHSYEEVLDKVNKRLKEVEIPIPRRRRDRISYLKSIYLKKLETAYNIIDNELSIIITALDKISKAHPFYKELFKVRVEQEPEKLLRYFKKRKKILRKIYLEHILPLKLTDYEIELRTRFRSCLGRMLSILKRKKRLIQLIKESIKELSKMPSISEQDINVIVAGMPQVGKSTLVSKLSTAKPEIASYPFTTKNIIIGHKIIDPARRIAFIDTPGILDRPLEERNEIELKAIYALKYLADKTIFLVDVSVNAYYSLKEQLNVLEDVLKIVGDKPVIVCINKIDISTRESIEKAKKELQKYNVSRIREISAYTGQGLDELLKDIINDP